MSTPDRLSETIEKNHLDAKEEKIYLLRCGDLCPQCKQGHMDYDGMLNLSCTLCGYTSVSSGSFT